MTIANDPNIPVDAGALGYALSFVPRGGLHGACAAQAVLAGLLKMAFSGRGEYYVWESPRGDDYIVSLALTSRTGEAVPSYVWWKEFVKAVAAACESRKEVIFDPLSSELVTVDSMRRHSLQGGIAVFTDGRPCIIDSTQDSWFLSECGNLIADRAGG